MHIILSVTPHKRENLDETHNTSLSCDKRVLVCQFILIVPKTGIALDSTCLMFDTIQTYIMRTRRTPK